MSVHTPPQNRVDAARLGFGDAVTHRAVFRGNGTRLVVIVNYIPHRTIISTVQSAVPPVVQHIIHKSQIAPHAHRGISGHIIGKQIPDHGTVESPKSTAKSMIVGIQSLCNNAVLHGNINRWQLLRSTIRMTIGFRCPHISVKRKGFVQPPGSRYMIQNDVANGVTTYGVIPAQHIGLSSTQAQMANNYIVGFNIHCFPCNHHPVAGSGLTGDGDVGRPNNQRILKLNDPRYIENHNTGTTCFTSFSKRAGTIIVQVGYNKNLSATATRGEHPSTLRSWESRNLCLWKGSWHTSPWNIRLPFPNLLFNGWPGRLPYFVGSRSYLLHVIGSLGLLVRRNGRILRKSARCQSKSQQSTPNQSQLHKQLFFIHTLTYSKAG